MAKRTSTWDLGAAAKAAKTGDDDLFTCSDEQLMQMFSGGQEASAAAGKGAKDGEYSVEQLMEILSDPNTQAAGEQGAAPPEELTFGFVKETLEKKGISWLTTDPEGKDDEQLVYCHSSVASPAILSQCQAVGFKVHISNKGQKQASRPVWLLHGASESQAVSWGQHIGTVRVSGKGGAKGGCGFVDCSEVKEQFGRDAYLHASVMEKCSISNGDTISFNVHTNPQGMPQVATPVWRMHDGRVATKGNDSWDGWGDGMDMASFFMGKGMGKGDMGGMDGMFGKGAGKGKPGDGLTLGTIKSIFPDKGWSYISCEDSWGKDVFLHRSACDPQLLKEGQHIAFTLGQGPKGPGQPQAQAPIWLLHGSTEYLKKGVFFGRNVGTVKTILATGNGYVSSDTVKQMFGTDNDAFVHASVARDCALQQGDTIAFNIHKNKDNMPQVSAPCWKLVSNDSWGGKGWGGDGGDDWAWDMFSMMSAMMGEMGKGMGDMGKGGKKGGFFGKGK